MKVLGIDTSGLINTIGLIDGQQILADLAWEARSNSLAKIISHIDFLLANTGLTLKDVQGLGVGIGPGAWTGVKVGVTVGKVLAYATNKPICGISSLDVLAYNAKNMPMLVCPIRSANKDTIYAAFYRTENGIFGRVSDYFVGAIGKLLKMVKEPTVFLGDAARLYRETIEKTIGSLSVHVEPPGNVQRGAVLAFLAGLYFERGESDNTLSLEPLYLKQPTAQALLDKEPTGD